MAEVERRDLIVIGGGSAGFAAGLRGADLGARVALVEGGVLGGTCVNVGCVPSKTLIRAAEARHRRTGHPFEGIPATDGAPEWARVRGQKDELVDRLRGLKYRDVLAGRAEIDLVQGRATFVSPDTLALSDGRTLCAPRIVIATGSSPVAPEVPGLRDAGFLDSTRAMALEALPDSLLILGSGYVAVELGQMFARLGVRVTLLARGDRVLRDADPDVGRELTEHLRAEGLIVRTGMRALSVARADRYQVAVASPVGREILEADQILVATGRRANTLGFGLREVGVALGDAAEVRVDDYLETSLPGVYAAGDVTGGPMFVYVAAYAGALAAENALQGKTRTADLSAVPGVIFTDPGVASVGLTEADARARGLDPLVTRVDLEHVPRALAARDTRGFVKLVADPGSRRILGGQILAAEAGEMITEVTFAIRFGLTIEDLTSTFHPYLTLAEGIKLAAQTFDKDVRALSCCAA